MTRPVKELKGSKRTTIELDQTKAVTLAIMLELLTFYNIDREYCVESGTFEIIVGNFSRVEDLQKIVLTFIE